MKEPYKLKLASGTELDLRYSFKALRFLEKVTNGHFFSDSLNKIGTDYLSGGIAAGLLWKHPDITTDKVDNMIEVHMESGGTIPDVLDGLIAALKASGVLNRPEGEAPSSAIERPTKGAAPAAQ